MRWIRCTLCHRPFQAPIGLYLNNCERHEADDSMDLEYLKEQGEARDNEVCHCRMSNAKAGHIHERGGYILCLHNEWEDGKDCLAALVLNDLPGVILHQY